MQIAIATSMCTMFTNVLAVLAISTIQQLQFLLRRVQCMFGVRLHLEKATVLRSGMYTLAALVVQQRREML